MNPTIAGTAIPVTAAVSHGPLLRLMPSETSWSDGSQRITDRSAFLLSHLLSRVMRIERAGVASGISA